MKIFAKLTTLTIIMISTSVCSASDIASSVRQGRTPDAETYKTFELGVSVGYIDNPHIRSQDDYDEWYGTIDAAGEIRLKHFFFEASQGTQDGLNIGFSLWRNESWSVDFLAASMRGNIVADLSEDEERGNDEYSRNKRNVGEETFYMGTGMRLTRYFKNTVLQYRLVSDTYGNNGLISTLRFGRGWQVRNWHFSAILSAQYTSSETNNYWYGVEASEATERFPQYRAPASTHYSLLLNATKPISEKIVMRAYLGYSPVDDKLRESPLINEPATTAAFLTLNYVFF